MISSVCTLKYQFQGCQTDRQCRLNINTINVGQRVRVIEMRNGTFKYEFFSISYGSTRHVASVVEVSIAICIYYNVPCLISLL